MSTPAPATLLFKKVANTPPARDVLGLLHQAQAQQAREFRAIYHTASLQDPSVRVTQTAASNPVDDLLSPLQELRPRQAQLHANLLKTQAISRAGLDALTPLAMRAVTEEVANLNIQTSLVLKVVGSAVNTVNQLARGS